MHTILWRQLDTANSKSIILNSLSFQPKTISLVCPSVIYYRLFWTPTISNCFCFPWEFELVQFNCTFQFIHYPSLSLKINLIMSSVKHIYSITVLMKITENKTQKTSLEPSLASWPVGNSHFAFRELNLENKMWSSKPEHLLCHQKLSNTLFPHIC